MKSSALSQLIAFYEQHGAFPLPICGGDGTEGENPQEKPTRDSKGAVTFKDQETFEAVLKSRIDQSRRSWESSERPKLIEEVTEQVRADIEAEAKRKADEEAGRYREMYEQLLEEGDIASLPKESRLYKLVHAAIEDKRENDKAINALVEDESKELSDAMKALIPDGYSPQKKLDWIRNAKKAAESTTSTRRRGSDHQDPQPGPEQGLTVEDVIAELQSRIPYGARSARR